MKYMLLIYLDEQALDERERQACCVESTQLAQPCGIHPYGEAVDTQGNRTAAINICCVEGIDLASVPVQHFDGRSM